MPLECGAIGYENEAMLIYLHMYFDVILWFISIVNYYLNAMLSTIYSDIMTFILLGGLFNLFTKLGWNITKEVKYSLCTLP